MVDSVVVLIVTIGIGNLQGFGNWLFEGMVRLSAGVVAATAAVHVALALPTFLAAWAG